MTHVTPASVILLKRAAASAWLARPPAEPSRPLAPSVPPARQHLASVCCPHVCPGPRTPTPQGHQEGREAGSRGQQWVGDSGGVITRLQLSPPHALPGPCVGQEPRGPRDLSVPTDACLPGAEAHSVVGGRRLQCPQAGLLAPPPNASRLVSKEKGGGLRSGAGVPVRQITSTEGPRRVLAVSAPHFPCLYCNI